MQNPEKIFGLIGKKISYSFSPKYFNEKFKFLNLNYEYKLFDIENIGEIERIFKLNNLKGLNVTIPYKENIIKYLDELSDEAKSIGAVNCIAFENGKKVGYNTDSFGFEKSLEKLNRKIKSAIILGDGGAAQAIKFVLNKHNIIFKSFTRNGENKITDITKDLIFNTDLVIQTTPVGTFPNIENTLDFPFESISDKHSVIDIIYNPAETKFMRLAGEKGAKCLNGKIMLENQAEKAYEIWQMVKK